MVIKAMPVADDDGDPVIISGHRGSEPAAAQVHLPEVAAPPAGADQVWKRVLQRVGLVYLFSRLCVVLGAAIVAAELGADRLKQQADFPLAPYADPNYTDRAIPTNAIRPMLDVLSSWDGAWYLRIINNGYPKHVQDNVTFNVDDARAAFFPLFPTIVRGFDFVLPGRAVVASLFVNFVLGAVAILLVGIMARRRFDIPVAEKAMVLMALFPGSFVLSFAYSEALLIVLAAGCLLCLMDERWLAAGVLAALGTAARPNGLALVVACAVAAFLAIRRRRDWASLIAPLLAPFGFIIFQLWVGIQAGEFGVWFRVQGEAWDEGTSFGLQALQRSLRAFTDPLSRPADILAAASMLAMVAMLWFAWKHRMPWPWVGYCAGVLFLMLLPSTVTARPRFLYTAFPLLIPSAAYLHHRGRELWPYVIAAGAAGLVGLTGLYGSLGAIP